MEFLIGQTFVGEYPPEAAVWCNTTGKGYIQEIEAIDSQRRFQIVATPQQSLDDIKSAKLSELDSRFLQWYEDDAILTSSLGFVVDSDARAILDVNGLVVSLESSSRDQQSTVVFMDHDNVPHTLTLDQLKIIQLEIINNGQSAYKQKWTYRDAITSSVGVESLNAIEIKFVGEDFTQQ